MTVDAATIDFEDSSVARVLAKRAERIAAPQALSDAGGAIAYRVLVARAGDQLFGLPAGCVSAVLPCPAITHLPSTPPWMLGLAQIRGEVVGVVDLCRWLGLESPAAGPMLVVIEERPGKLGLLFDELVGLRDVRETELAPLLANESDDPRIFAATTKDLVGIVAPDRLFGSRRIRIGGEHGAASAADKEKADE